MFWIIFFQVRLPRWSKAIGLHGIGVCGCRVADMNCSLSRDSVGPCVEAPQPHLTSAPWSLSAVLPEQFFLSGLVLGPGKCQDDWLTLSRQGSCGGGGNRRGRWCGEERDLQTGNYDAVSADKGYRLLSTYLCAYELHTDTIRWTLLLSMNRRGSQGSGPITFPEPHSKQRGWNSLSQG